jgi:beta-galactosidase
LAGIAAESLCDWRGEATILPPRLKFDDPRRETVRWCDIPVTRVWRCGNRGNVASVLIEKPACGNFLPIVDGGFSLQYSPLMEYREGRGMVLFCQMDVTGRTESDAAADRLTRNILNYVSDWKPSPVRKALYAGDPAGKAHLEKAGVETAAYDGGKLSAEQVLIVGPGGGKQLSAHAAVVGEWLAAGGRLLGIGLDQADVKPLLPGVTMKKAEHIAAYFEPPATGSTLAGVGPADVHNRAPKDYWLVTGGAKAVGDGVLAASESGNVVFCQAVPWQCDYSKQQHNIKQTFRRASFLVTRLLGNLGVEEATPVLARFSSPVDAKQAEKRWLKGLYLDEPEEWDDPYRAFRW